METVSRISLCDDMYSGLCIMALEGLKTQIYIKINGGKFNSCEYFLCLIICIIYTNTFIKLDLLTFSEAFVDMLSSFMISLSQIASLLLEAPNE